MPPKIAASKLSSVPIKKYSAKRSDLPSSGNRAMDFAASTSPTVAGDRRIIAVSTRLRSSHPIYIPALRKLSRRFVAKLRQMSRQRPREIADRVAAREYHGKIDHQHRKNSVALRNKRRKASDRRHRARASDKQRRRNDRHNVRRLVGQERKRVVANLRGRREMLLAEVNQQMRANQRDANRLKANAHQQRRIRKSGHHKDRYIVNEPVLPVSRPAVLLGFHHRVGLQQEVRCEMPKAQNQKYFDRVHRCLSEIHPSLTAARQM